MRKTNGPARRQRHNRILKRAKGYRGGRHALYRTAATATLRAGVFAFVGRRQKKRHFRRLWITRLSAAAQQHGILYSRFIHGIQKLGVRLNRKELSELAIHDPKTFEQLCTQVKQTLAA